ncbi:MAG: ribonuclease [Verrucomicrobiales bacterium]|nr:ribonuclease [Verrucomicrobiales bacterium]
MHEDKISKLLGRTTYKPSNVPELIQQLGLQPNQQQELQETLRKLEISGEIVRTKGNRYIKAREADLIAGTIQINRQGKGFLRLDEPGQQELVIAESATSTAMNGDRVLVRRDVKRGRPGETQMENTGTVIRILERKRSQLVGTLQQGRQFLYVIPDDPRIPHDISVPPARDVGRPANIGDKVVVELLNWESRNSNPEGEIIEVLGTPDEEGVDMLSVLRNYELPLHFPKPVLLEANTITKSRSLTDASDADMEGRTDCRDHSVVTIDPDDAKDFDDAICLQRVSHERWKLWVHIADVSHYVKTGSPLDEEARKRGNSTYLVDRVIPMLPEALSNELCSLKPGVDRLTKCVEFLLSNDGKVMDATFYPAVIRSKRRFTYKEVFAILQKEPADPIERLLHDANDMAQRIRRARFKAGSLDLDFPENKIRLDAHGRVLLIEKVENDISHQLIEEYMLLANEAVATRLISLRRPAPHRIHEPPKEQKLREFREDVVSHHIPCGNLNQRPEVQKLLAKLNTIPIGRALKIGFLKSLMRARYSIDPIGHYGLAKQKYAHFTSPIRRYADLMVHRALFDNANATKAKHSMKETADHISETERNSSDAERDSKEVKLYAYLKSQLKTGEMQKYSGLVIDVRNFGFFVDVGDLCMSGLVHLSSIQDDFFIFDPTRDHLIGRRSRRIIKLGDKLDVQVYKVDTFKKQVDFELVKTAAAAKGGVKAPEATATEEPRFFELPRKRDDRRPPQGDRNERQGGRSQGQGGRNQGQGLRTSVQGIRRQGQGGRSQGQGARTQEQGSSTQGQGPRSQAPGGRKFSQKKRAPQSRRRR